MGKNICNNRQIIGKIYQKIRHEIYSIFRQACIAEDTCDDMVQDVFEKILGLDIIIEDQLKGLAVQIAYQKRTDYLRHRALINKVHNDSLWRMEQTVDSRNICIKCQQDNTSLITKHITTINLAQQWPLVFCLFEVGIIFLRERI